MKINYLRTGALLLITAILGVSPDRATAISPNADQWQYCSYNGNSTKCFDSLGAAEAWMRQEPDVPNGRRFLELSGELQFSGPVLNPTSIKYKYKVKPRGPEDIAENYLNALKTGFKNDVGCGCAGGAPICYPVGWGPTCVDIPGGCVSCVNGTGDAGPIRAGLLDFYAEKCGLSISGESPWPNPANTVGSIGQQNGIYFPPTNGGFIYYNGLSQSYDDPRQPFNKIISVTHGDLVDGQCLNISFRASFHVRRTQRFVCEAGMYPANGVVNSQNYYSQQSLISPDEVCRSAQTGEITAYQVPSEQCAYNNPCVPSTGAKIQDDTDFASGNLRFTRHYNSNRTGITRDHLGEAWHSNYGLRLASPSLTESTHVVGFDEGGNLERFDRQGVTLEYRSSNVSGEVLTKISASHWVLQDRNNRRFHFDGEGKLLSIETVGEPAAGVTLNYSSTALFDENGEVLVPAGQLTSVTDARGRSIGFVYGKINQDVDCFAATSVPGCKGLRLLGATLPDGQNLEYEYNLAGMLSTVIYPDLSQKRYHYNEAEHICPVANPAACTGGSPPAGGFPSLMTGISHVDPPSLGGDVARFSTYQYDHRSRVISSEREGGAGRITLDYVSNHSVTLDLPEGKSRTITTDIKAGLYPKQTAWSDTSTAGVLPASSYVYDTTGRLQSVIDPNGTQRTYAFDASNLRVSTVVNAATTPEARRTETDWDHALGVVLETRVKDAANTLRSRTTFQYNPRGQVLTQTAIDPVTAATRTTTYTYCEADDVALPNSTCPILGLVKSVNGPRTDVCGHHRVHLPRRHRRHPAAPPPAPATARATCGRSPTHSATSPTSCATTLQAASAQAKNANGVITEFGYHPRGWLLTRTVKGRHSSVRRMP
jgi:YD repeat-containing protein